MKINKQYVKPSIIGICSAIALFFLFGVITAIIPNIFFIRMTPISWIEYASLGATSVLLGAYIGLSNYGRIVASNACNATATSGGVAGFLTFGCSLCNKVLLLLFGVTGVLTYFEPIRPFFGFLGTGLLGGAIVYKGKQLRKAQRG